MTKRTIKSFSVKTLAIFLSVLMIFYLIPATAYASLFEAAEAESVVSETTKRAGEVFEDISRREENVKHFRLEDGTYMAAQYDTAVHTLDENGEWQDIDNTLSESGSEYSTSNARIKFAKKITGNESIFTLHENNRKITLSLDGAIKKTPGVATNTETEFDETATTLQKMMTLDKLSSRIIYEDILDGVDLEYIVNGNNIKENIIVKEKKDNYVYSFTMKLNNLTAVMMDDGSIIICDESSGEAVYTMPAPVMWDAAYNTSNAASMALTAHGNGAYTINVIANSEWMNDPQREFPVVIDPALSNDVGGMASTCVDSSNPSQSWTSSDIYKISNSISTYVKCGYLPTIPNFAYITSASICMRVSQTSSYFNGNIGAYEVLTDWDTSLTYNDTIATFLPEGQVSTDSDYLLDYNYILSTSLPAWTFYWDITNKVKDWYSGEDNYGIAFKIVADTTASGTLSFAGNNYPYLTVTYKDMYGLEDYWSFASHSAGLAGDGYVNLATGNLVLNINTLTTTDALLPFTSSLTYNSSLSSKYYTNENRNVAYNSPTAPLGFMANLFQSIVPQSRSVGDGGYETYYIYTDADGTEHAFLPSSDPEETNIYYDEDGLQLKLTVNSSTNQIIEDADYNQYVFSSAPYSSGGTVLSSIISADGYKLTINQDEPSQAYLITLKPYAALTNTITQLLVSYCDDGDTQNNQRDGLIKYYLNQNTNQVVLLYYDVSSKGCYLSKIVYAHSTVDTDSTYWDNHYNSIDTTSTIKVDATCYYDYDTNNRLIEIRDEMNQRVIRYQYDSADRVIKITEYGGTTSLTTGQSIGITYYDGYTKVRTSGSNDYYGDNDDNITVYSFDNQGRCITNFSTDITGYKLFGATAGEYTNDNEKANNSLKTSLSIGHTPTNFLINSDFRDVTGWTPNYWTCSGDVEALAEGDSESLTTGYNKTLEDTSYSVKMEAPSSTPASIEQTISLYPGTYTLNASLISLYETDISVTLTAKKDGIIISEKEIPVRYANSSLLFDENSEGFLTFDVEGSSMQSITVGLTLNPGNSSSYNIYNVVYLQHISLSKSYGSTFNNKVEFGSFENIAWGSSNEQLSWSNAWTKTAGAFSITNECYNNDPFDTALKITARGVDKSDYCYQTLYEATQEEINAFKTNPYSIPSKSYQVSARGYSDNAFNNTKSLFGVVVTINYVSASLVNGSLVYTPQEQVFYLPFNTDAETIQYVLGHIETEKDWFVTKIEVKCDFSHQNAGAVAYFDDVALCYVGTNTALNKTEYNDDGYVTEIHSGFYHTWYIYSGKYITTEINNNQVITYTYDTSSGKEHRVVTSKCYAFSADPNENNGGYTSTSSLTLQSTTTYQYNALGQVISTQINAGGKRLITQSSYITDSSSHIIGLCISQTNELGKTTYYQYDNDTGHLLAVLYPDGSGLSYDYDDLGRLQLVYPAEWVESNTYPSHGVVYSSKTDAESVSYQYEENTGRLLHIETGTTKYNFTYDAFGNSNSITVGNTTGSYYTLADYDYNSQNGKLNRLTYGNGNSVEYTYDELDRVVEICYNGSVNSAFTYTYDSNGNLSEFYDHISNQVTSYIYDKSGMLKTYYVKATDENSIDPSFVDYTYDSQGRTVGVLYSRYCNVGSSLTALSYDTTISYNSFDLLSSSITYLNGYNFYQYYSYNGLGALTSEEHSLFYEESDESPGYTLNYVYSTGSYSAFTSLQVSSVTTQYYDTSIAANSTTAYTYDSVGNITAITIDGSLKYSYQYDDLGQLIRENNAVANRTYVYTYDNAGNILSKKTYGYSLETDITTTLYSTKNYTYTDSSWGDLLTSYGGITFTYDNAGNPTSGSFANSIVALEWENGRQLSWIYAEDEFELSFTYNDEGIRTSKVSDGTVHYYTLAGDMILSEEWTIGTVQQLILYHYDASGQPIGMSYRRSSYAEGIYDHYLFIKNIQGDITGIIDEDGTLLVTYAYDAWGNHVSTVYSNGGGTTGARYNPFRYRGYYYDTETGLYYLNSRYYDPASGRFISPDSASYIGADGTLIGYNLFAYCGNNPVNFVDSYGHSPEWWHWTLFGVGVALTAVAAGMAVIGTGGVGAFGMGALIGSLSVGCVGAVVGGSIGYAAEGEEGILEGVLIGFGIGSIVGFVVGGTIGYYDSLVQIDIRKFTDYALDPAKSNGKHAVFNKLGYNQSDARSLVKIYKKQGLKNYLKNNYTLGKPDMFGQRITMGIKIGDQVLKSGWMLLEKGIRLITPFSGYMD